MPGTNLTRAEAAERVELLRVQSYQVELDLTTGPETFRSATRIAFQCERPGAATFVDLIAPQVHEVVLQLRGRAGDRQVPGDPRVGYTQLYGAPGTAGVSILSR